MHFYYFLYIFCHISQISRVFPLFSVSSGSRCHSFGCRALTCQPWGVVRCGYPHGLPAAKKQKYSDDDYDSSRRRGRSFARPCRARDRVLSKLGQFQMSVYKFVLQVSQEGRCTFSLFVLLERQNLFLARHAFILIRE